MKYFLIVLTVFTLVVTGIMYPELPSSIPRHWNVYGEVDGYMQKEYLFLFALLPIAFYFLFPVLRKIDPKSKNYERHEKTYELFRLLIVILLFGVYFLSLYAAKGYAIEIGQIVPIFVGVVFIVIGNYLPKVKQNFFLGIRTPWTLMNEKVWAKTHRFGGRVFIYLGIIIFLGAFLHTEWFAYLMVSSILGGVVLMFAYSYVIYKKEEGK